MNFGQEKLQNFDKESNDRGRLWEEDRNKGLHPLQYPNFPLLVQREIRIGPLPMHFCQIF